MTMTLRKVKVQTSSSSLRTLYELRRRIERPIFTGSGMSSGVEFRFWVDKIGLLHPPNPRFLTRLSFGAAANNHVPNYVFLFRYALKSKSNYWLAGWLPDNHNRLQSSSLELIVLRLPFLSSIPSCTHFRCQWDGHNRGVSSVCQRMKDSNQVVDLTYSSFVPIVFVLE